ncbi:MAG: YwaF family protein [Solibacillus sp.]
MAGFAIFDTIHLTWLSFITISIILASYLYTRFSTAYQQRYQKFIFWLLLLLECAKQIFLLITNQYSYWSPPLHLCGLGIFITGLHAYRPSRTTATLLYALTLPGAVIALLFPGWTMDPVGDFLHIHSFVFHALLVMFVCPLIHKQQLDLRWQDLWRAALFLITTVPIIYAYNAAFQTNFMFLNRPVAGTPLQWLYDGFDSSGYLISLTAVVLVLWLILYIPIRKRGA